MSSCCFVNLGLIKYLEQTVNSVIEQLDDHDIWLVVLDNQNIEEYEHIKKNLSK